MGKRLASARPEQETGGRQQAAGNSQSTRSSPVARGLLPASCLLFRPLLSLSLAATLPATALAQSPRPIVTVVGAPVLGVDQETEVRVELPEGWTPSMGMPRVVASAGRVDDLVPAGPRAFMGRYLLPAERFPQAAIVVAEIGDPPARGFTVVKLRAAASPAFRTDPGAAVTLRIGEKEFGPQRAARDGSVRVPVVVPPGVTYGVARSVNEFGQATEQTVDLRIPPFRRLLLVAPEAVPAGSVREVAVYGVDSAGLPLDPAAFALRVTPAAPRPQPLGGDPGEARFLVRAPATATPGRAPVRLEATLRAEPEQVATAEVRVTAGPARRLVLRPDRPRLPLRPGASMRVYLSAEDRFGNPTDASAAAVLVDGVRVETRTAEDGRAMAVVPAPPYSGRDHLQLEAVLGEAYATDRVALTGLPFPPLRPAGRLPRLVVTPRLGVLWSLHRPAGAALLLEALGRPARWPEWLLVGLSVGMLTVDSTASDQLGISDIDLLELPVLAIARCQRRVAPRLLVAAGGGVGAVWTDARVTSFGREVPGQRVAPAAEVGGEAAVPLRAGQLVVGVRYLAIRVGRLSSGDELLGNTGGLLADLGYRLAW